MAAPAPLTVKVALPDGRLKAMRFAANTQVSECIASILERTVDVQDNKADMMLLHKSPDATHGVPMRHDRTLEYYLVKKDVRWRCLFDPLLRHAIRSQLLT